MIAQTLATLPGALRPVPPGTRLLTDERGHVGPEDFEALVVQCSQWLRAQGIGPGDRVGVWLVNRIEWLVLLLALARTGATLVAINTRYRAAEVGGLLERTSARLLVMQDDFRGIDFAAVLAGIDGDRLPALERVALVGAAQSRPGTLLGRPTVALELDARAAAAPTPRDDSDPDAVAILYATSGTTRQPKLVMHTQRSLAVHACHVARAHGLDADGAGLVGALPLCGTFGLTACLAALAGGAPIVLMEAVDASRIATLLREQGLTHAYGTDEMFRRLRDIAPGVRPFPSARVFGYAAFQPGSVDFARTCIEAGIPMAGMYGSSEVQALFSLQRQDAPAAECAVGGGYPAAPQARVRVRDLETGNLAEPGVVGEIEIRAPGNFAGYLDDPEATAAVVDDEGYFRTGDLGRLRGDGSFVYLTRRGDAIRLGGFLVNPAEIEDALAHLDDVREAAVIAVPIDRQVRPVAFVTLEPGRRLDEAALIRGARERIAGYKVPVRIWQLDDLPMTVSANGAKLQRAQLRELALARLAPG